MSTNLASIVTETAERIPDGIAYKLDDTEVNWQAVDEGSARVAGPAKEKGLEPGDRVAMMLPNVPYFPIVYYGDPARGWRGRADERAPQGPRGQVLPRGLRGEVALRLARLRRGRRAGRRGGGHRGHPRQARTSSRSCSATPSPPATSPTATATTLRSSSTRSGTTGQPKGAELTHDNMLANAKASRDLFSTDDDDIVLGALPLFHAFGQTVLHERLLRSAARR